eukprot:CAMPEP_0204217060 /NCGR_PEP_ID=MMETSP0361-20130328/78636_1 /ASSEMBLY_ACC=CAM_ASM_000343 /TAXON_ID=268821 /ORGANISM="Scrippsiella Hangoei, Strain SHTV-5" /LENGTH=53 /DNA_ID=CAMNT_0051182017 /DNA_START=80 /DNA_END=237 /DNA_ORIENTATION=+
MSVAAAPSTAVDRNTSVTHAPPALMIFDMSPPKPGPPALLIFEPLPPKSGPPA